MKSKKEIPQRLKSENCGYKGSKPSSQDWAGMLYEDPDFAEEFKRVFNNANIPKAEDFTPEVLEDTYVYMEIAFTRYGEGPEIAKVKNVCGMQMVSQ